MHAIAASTVLMWTVTRHLGGTADLVGSQTQIGHQQFTEILAGFGSCKACLPRQFGGNGMTKNYRVLAWTRPILATAAGFWPRLVRFWQQLQGSGLAGLSLTTVTGFWPPTRGFL